MSKKTGGTVIEGRFTRDENRFPFQVDDSLESGDPAELRVLRVGPDGEVVGDVIFAQTDEGDVLIVCRRFDEAGFGSLNVVLA